MHVYKVKHVFKSIFYKIFYFKDKDHRTFIYTYVALSFQTAQHLPPSFIHFKISFFQSLSFISVISANLESPDSLDISLWIQCFLNRNFCFLYHVVYIFLGVQQDLYVIQVFLDPFPASALSVDYNIHLHYCVKIVYLSSHQNVYYVILVQLKGYQISLFLPSKYVYALSSSSQTA